MEIDLQFNRSEFSYFFFPVETSLHSLIIFLPFAFYNISVECVSYTITKWNEILSQIGLKRGVLQMIVMIWAVHAKVSLHLKQINTEILPTVGPW